MRARFETKKLPLDALVAVYVNEMSCGGGAASKLILVSSTALCTLCFCLTTLVLPYFHARILFTTSMMRTQVHFCRVSDNSISALENNNPARIGDYRCSLDSYGSQSVLVIDANGQPESTSAHHRYANRNRNVSSCKRFTEDSIRK